MADEALQRRLLGQRDSRGPVGILSRGKNVYSSTSSSAQSGGGSQYGRPKTNPVQSSNVQPNLRMEDSSMSQEGPTNMNPQPVNLMQAIQRRLGGQSGIRS